MYIIFFQIKFRLNTCVRAVKKVTVEGNATSKDKLMKRNVFRLRVSFSRKSSLEIRRVHEHSSNYQPNYSI